MKETKSFTTVQMTTLVVLRLLIGWHCLYEGIAKVMNPSWSARGFLSESKWILSGITNWILSHSNVLLTVDFLNTWGLVAIGAGLMLGLFSRPAAISGTILLLLYYACNPPLVGLEYSVPLEGSNLVVSKSLIEAIALFILAIFPTSHIFGLDLYVSRFKNKKTK